MLSSPDTSLGCPTVTDAPLPDTHAAPAPDAAAAAALTQTTLADVAAATRSRRFDIDCQLQYMVQAPTHFMLQIEAEHVAGQTVESELLTLTPDVPRRHFKDERTGNRFVRFDVTAGPLAIGYRAQVALHAIERRFELPEVPVNQLPDDVVHYLMPTRYCESDHFVRASQKLFGDVPPGRQRVEHICDWIHENVEYKLGTSDATTGARDVFLNRAGVCRDFAHLGITFCRALNIPARLVVGYVKFDMPPPDFHAIFEAYLGGQWVLFDPTRLAPPERLVRIATGRDAKDVAFATLFGPATMTSMAPQIEEIVAG